MAEKKQDGKIIAENRKAWHDFFVDERFEAGIALFGTEVKSLRKGAVNLKDSYCEIRPLREFRGYGQGTGPRESEGKACRAHVWQGEHAGAGLYRSPKNIDF